MILALVLAGCAAGHPRSGPAWNEPEPEYKEHYEPMSGPVELKPVQPPPPGQGGEVQTQWTICAKDSECTAVETDCCGFVAINREHWDDARAVLPYSTCDMLCPTNVQTACVEGRCEVVL